MKSALFGAALLAAFALPAAAQVSTTVSGQVTPTKSAAKVKLTVDPGLAAQAKVSADSAYAIARARANNGEVSSARLETSKGRLIYKVNVLNKSKRASTVKVDAMTGEVIEAEEHGGLKSTAVHHKENKKLLDAKRDSAKTKP